MPKHGKNYARVAAMVDRDRADPYANVSARGRRST